MVRLRISGISEEMALYCRSRRSELIAKPSLDPLVDYRSQNWHPILLLRIDYKVIVRAISLRPGSVLADVVHPDQTYTFPGRTIFDNLYLVWDVLDLRCREGLLFAILSLDPGEGF
ncbi:unnamed protein product [Caretta caretta]